jgi:small-conductance mechanosensitive channel
VNVKGQIFLAIWDRFKEHGIEIPYPQRDIHLRTIPPGFRDDQRDTRPAAGQRPPAHQMASAGNFEGPDLPDD